MSKDYQDGFKDGFTKGLEEGKKLIQFPWTPKIDDLSARSSCPKCGIRFDGPMGYVCGSINCPIMPPAYSHVSGAVGSSYSNIDPKGSNGSTGSDDLTWNR